MAIKSFRYGKHTIMVDLMADGMGKESVMYDGAEVASGRSVTGGNHSFTVNEDGKNIRYEVRMKTTVGQFFGGTPKVELFRDGIKIG